MDPFDMSGPRDFKNNELGFIKSVHDRRKSPHDSLAPANVVFCFLQEHRIPKGTEYDK